MKPISAAAAMFLITLVTLSGAATEQPADKRPAGSQATSSVTDDGRPDDSRPVVVDLVASVSTAAPAQPFKLGLAFRVAPGWHIYAPWPGNTGEPTGVTFSTSTPYATVSSLVYQHPSTFDRDDRDLIGFGYTDATFIQAEAVVGDKPESGEVEFTADLKWLACKTKCVGGGTTTALTVAVGDTAVPAADLTPFAAKMPTALDPDRASLAAVAYRDGIWDLRYKVSGFTKIEDFVPQWMDEGDCIVDRWEARPVAGAAESWDLLVKMRGGDCLPFAGGFLKAVPKDSAAAESFRFKSYGLDPWKAEDANAVSGEGGTAGTAAQGAGGTGGSATGEGTGAPSATPEISGPEAPNGGFSWYFLLMAFAGGLLLNVMPCVIPVIVPKLNHLVKTAVTFKEKRERRRMLLVNSLAYSAGIFLTMIGIAVVVVILKTAGHQVGWGFQFQNPVFLAVMVSVLMLMSLGMLGVFPLQAASHTEDLRDLRAMRKQSLTIESFLTGLLVTFLGTPCTAPLLGPAVGFAFLAGTVQIFAFFAVLALGFSLPFILLAVFPGWADHLKNFRVSEEGNKWSHGLAFFLLATMVWLLGVIGGTYGLDGVSDVLWFLLTLSILAWVYGLRCETYEKKAESRLESAEKGIAADAELDAKARAAKKESLRQGFYRDVRRRRAITAGMLLAIAVACGVFILRFDDTAKGGGTMNADSPVKWQKWSQAEVDRARAAGKTVFVDVTAAWCMNCKTNEKLILDRTDTADMFRDMGIAAFQADFSRREPAIAALIAQYKRVGVPVYLVYPPCTGEPLILPEILTPDIFQSAIKQVGPSLKDGCRAQ